MKLFVCLLCILCVVFAYTNIASAGVIYEFVESGTGDVLGTLNFLDTVASATSGWTAPVIGDHDKVTIGQPAAELKYHLSCPVGQLGKN